jgi:hypothetical protein
MTVGAFLRQLPYRVGRHGGSLLFLALVDPSTYGTPTSFGPLVAFK